MKNVQLWNKILSWASSQDLYWENKIDEPECPQRMLFPFAHTQLDPPCDFWVVLVLVNSDANWWNKMMIVEHIESGYAIRNSKNNLAVPSSRTNCLKTTLSYRDATLWNSQLCDLRRERSFNRFKQLLNRHSNWLRYTAFMENWCSL